MFLVCLFLISIHPHVTLLPLSRCTSPIPLLLSADHLVTLSLKLSNHTFQRYTALTLVLLGLTIGTTIFASTTIFCNQIRRPLSNLHNSKQHAIHILTHFSRRQPYPSVQARCSSSSKPFKSKSRRDQENQLHNLDYYILFLSSHRLIVLKRVA